MLAFTRREGEEVVIGDPAAPLGIVRVSSIKGDRVRLAFDFSREIPVNRREVADQINSNQPGKDGNPIDGQSPPASTPLSSPQKVNPSNRFGWDYRALGAQFPKLPFAITDAHSHVNGGRASAILREAMDLFGIGSIWSMTYLEQVPAVRAELGDRLRLIAVPDFASKDRKYALGAGFLERIGQYHELGSRLCKIWAAPRSVDYAIEAGDATMFELDAPIRIAAMDMATKLGMSLMVHIADPDTWFQTRYSDAARYGTKSAQYLPLERLLDRFTAPWLAAHMGGWPEDLNFLTGLLDRHPNLFLDTSATKWILREISKHPAGAVQNFLERFRGRILFGSDIVTTDEHMIAGESKSEMAAKASRPEDAFDLYASRYWALRTLWESRFDGESPIADPDLAMVDPKRFSAMDAPRLRGQHLPASLLKSLYVDAAANFISAGASVGAARNASGQTR